MGMDGLRLAAAPACGYAGAGKLQLAGLAVPELVASLFIVPD